MDTESKMEYKRTPSEEGCCLLLLRSVMCSVCLRDRCDERSVRGGRGGGDRLSVAVFCLFSMFRRPTSFEMPTRSARYFHEKCLDGFPYVEVMKA